MTQLEPFARGANLLARLLWLRPALSLMALSWSTAGCFLAWSSQPITPEGQQRRWARSLEPEELDSDERSGAAHRLGVLRVRAYLDEDLLAASRDPEGKVRQTVDDVSRILATQLGVGLDLVDVKTFQPRETELRAALAELKGSDRSTDVDLVVGFVRPAPAVTVSLDEIGVADVLGRYAVVRLLDDAMEVRDIAAALDRLPDSERGALLDRRRRHKAAIVVLHEIAHCLGGVHGQEPHSALFPTYSTEQTRIDDDDVAMMEIGIAWHRASDGDRAALALRLANELESRRRRLDERGLDAIIASLERRSAEVGTAPIDDRIVVAPADAEALNRAVDKANAGDHAGAWQLLAPIASRPDAHPRVLALACLVSSMDGVVVLDGKARCDRALAAAPDDIAPVLGALAFAIRTGDRETEVRLWDEAASRLARSPSPAPPPVLDLADTAQRRHRLSLAEDALALAPLDDERASSLRAQVATQRRRVGIRRGAVPAADEAAAAEAVLAIERATDTVAARKMADEAIERYGDIAGLLAARCGALWQARKLRDAEKVCASAVAKDDEASVAHVFTGILHAERGRLDRAEVELERALELDPDTKATWTVLATVLRRGGKTQALRALGARHQARFGAALP